MMMMMMPTFAVATAHAFVLTVSHGLLFRRPPFTATALLPPILFEFTRFHRAAARRSIFPNLNFRSLTQSQSGPGATSSIVALHRQNSSSRAYCVHGRIHKASRSEYDLNLAILYAVQSGFRYSASLFLPDLRCRPLGEIMLRASGQRGALIRGRFREPQTNRFQPIFQVLFYPPACLPDLQSRPAMLCVIART